MLNNKAQIPFINNLRGVASLCVCLYHFIYCTTNYVSDENILSVAYYGQYGVTLFFIISGMVIPLSLLRADYTVFKWHKFFLKRVIRIEPPYLVAIALSIIIIIARQKILNDNAVTFNFNQIVLHLGYLIPFFEHYTWLNEVFATLAIEFQYYLAMSVLILLVIKGGAIGRFIFYTVMLVLPFFYNNTFFFPAYSAMFLMGICWSLFYVNKISLIEFIVVLLLSGAMVYFKFGHIDGIMGLCIVIAVQFLNRYSNKLFDFFGNISYSLYLVHPLIGASIINVLSHSYFLSWQKPVVILFGLLITILSSYIMYRFVEKPTQLLSKRIAY